MNDSELMRWARGIWDKTFRIGRTPETLRAEYPDKPEDTLAHWAALADWADGGYYIIETGARFAAALISSKFTTDDLLTTPVVRTFLMRLPHGIFGDIDRCLTTFAFVHGDTDETLVYQWTWSSTNPPNSDMGLYSVPLSSALDETDASQGLRKCLSCLRLAIGLFITAATPHFVKERTINGKSGGGREAPPHRLAVIGKPIACDVRPAVRSYLAGHGRGMAAFQTVVRGHFKRQVVGVGRSARKIIFVEPYWRGPEDAPILVRPHHVGGPTEQVPEMPDPHLLPE